MAVSKNNYLSQIKIFKKIISSQNIQGHYVLVTKVQEEE